MEINPKASNILEKAFQLSEALKELDYNSRMRMGIYFNLQYLEPCLNGVISTLYHYISGGDLTKTRKGVRLVDPTPEPEKIWTLDDHVEKDRNSDK